MAENEAANSVPVSTRSGPWTDLGLTLPIFVGYHLGVVTLPVRNAADLVTRELVTLADNSMASYGALTLLIGLVYVGSLVILGRGQALRWERFLMIAAEGVAYAIAMRLLAAFIIGELFLANQLSLERPDAFTGVVMSLGAGFYEEVVFRVVLYGLGAKLLLILFPMPVIAKGVVPRIAWAVVAAAIFSGWHYVGELGDAFDLRSFVFRWVCGCIFTLIYQFRGFAPAVWTHTLYDLWVLVL